MRKKPRLTAIDLFCGAGGLSEGFRQAGYTVVAGSDIDAAAGETYKATHPDAEFILGRSLKRTGASALNLFAFFIDEWAVFGFGVRCAYSR